eukprot:8326226-Ditylum_brightwellii.AAC.1
MKYNLCVTTISIVDKLTAEQLHSILRAPKWNLPYIPAAKVNVNGDSTNQQLKSLTANVIHVHHLRRDINKSLAEKTTSSLIVSNNKDEIHAPEQMYPALSCLTHRASLWQ